MAAAIVNEHLPTPLTATSEQPPLFDGTTRLYIAYTCPFAQRVWIFRNYKGLHDKIELVPIDLQNRPAWYKEKVPSLEHNGKVIGESLDLIKYVDSNFEGPSLPYPNDPAKKEFSEELITYSDTFNKIVFASFKGDTVKEAGPAFDHLENALHKFNDGPFFLSHELSLAFSMQIPADLFNEYGLLISVLIGVLVCLMGVVELVHTIRLMHWLVRKIIKLISTFVKALTCWKNRLDWLISKMEDCIPTTLLGHVDFTRALLALKPQLAMDLDFHKRCPLHLSMYCYEQMKMHVWFVIKMEELLFTMRP
ncbi:hypothetical protein SO802_005035 [Lithocarpus litseifolius]|uniref:GST N-terminal domain-containing protein n=1 Tax=Lithocarpus litseifolius TaxID=425828 RepID=A0AAW2DHG3_9ROSI